MNDALKGYLSLATGLTEVTRQRATTTAKAMLASGEAVTGSVTSIADDLIAQSKSNREAVTALVKFEVDKALGRVGLATAEEVTELTTRIRQLESQLREAKGGAPAKKAPTKTPAKAPVGSATSKPAGTTPVEKTTATKAASTTAPKAPTKSAPTKSAPTKSAPTKSAPTKSAPTKSAPTKSAPTASAKKVPANKAPGTSSA